jgi:hypothetical protein
MRRLWRYVSRRQISKGHTSKIESYGRGDGSGFASGGPNLNPWCALASKRRLICGHEFGRAGQAGQGDGLEAGAAIIMPCLAMPVTEGVDVLSEVVPRTSSHSFGRGGSSPFTGIMLSLPSGAISMRTLSPAVFAALSRLTKSIARISLKSVSVEGDLIQAILNLVRGTGHLVALDRVDLDDDDVGTGGLVEQRKQGGIAHVAAVPIRHPVDFHRLKQIGQACRGHDVIGGEFSTFENLDLAGLEIGRRDN